MTSTTSEVVARLRSDAAQLLRMCEATKVCDDLSVRVKAPDLLISSMVEAADRIADLERLLAEAREALKPFAALGEHAAWMEKPDDKGAWGFDDAMLTWGDFRKAHQALEAQP